MTVHLCLASDNPNTETGVIHISLVGFKEQFKSFILLFLSYCEIDSSFLVNLLDFDLTQSLVLRQSNLYAIRQPSTIYSLKSSSCSLLIPPHHQQAYVNDDILFFTALFLVKRRPSYTCGHSVLVHLWSLGNWLHVHICALMWAITMPFHLFLYACKIQKVPLRSFLAVFWLLLLFVPPALLFSSPFALLLSTHRIQYVNASKKGFSVPSLQKGASEHGSIFSLNIFTVTSEPLILKSDMS